MPVLPSSTTSFWVDTIPGSSFLALQGDLGVDVAIVGGGITGITAALLLQRSGERVAVVEAQRIGRGVTGYTTAHLTEALDTRYRRLIEDFGVEGARLAADASREAITLMETFVRQLSPGCAWRRLPGYLYSEGEDDLGALHEEYEAARRAGLRVEMTREVPLPFATRAAIRFADQAQFHVREYLFDLCDAFQRAGGRIFEGSRVTSVEEGEPCRVVTDAGVVKAKHVVVAAHVPLTRLFLQPRLSHYRSYALALAVREPALEGLFWDTHDPYHYLRTAPVPGSPTDLLIVGGEDHKTGTEDHAEGCYERLLAYAQRRFTVEQVGFRWSGQIVETADGLPMIGRTSPSGRVFVATGYSGNGITFGTVAGTLLRDLIVGYDNPLSRLLDPLRIKPVAAAAGLVKDNAEVAAHFVGDRLRPPEARSLREIGPGEGKVVRVKGKRVAVFRQDDGKLQALLATCPHLGCQVHFNDAEKTWDCPCHGSRFDTSGVVLNGPAMTGLQPASVSEDDDRSGPARGRGAIWQGAVAGLVGTVAMSAAMTAAKGAGLLGEAPPYRIVKRVMRTLAPAMGARGWTVGAGLLHLAIGAAAGAVFGAGYLKTRGRLVAIVQGAVYGTAVWGASYGKLLPAVGLMPFPQHDRRGRPTAMLVAHGVYGAVLGGVAEALRH